MAGALALLPAGRAGLAAGLVNVMPGGRLPDGLSWPGYRLPGGAKRRHRFSASVTVAASPWW